MMNKTSPIKNNTYKIYQVFELPNLMLASSLTPAVFLDNCLDSVLKRNQFNLENRAHRASDYFTNLNNKERQKIPFLIRRLNFGIAEQSYGLMSFIASREEKVKHKISNQRIFAINTDVLIQNRIAEIIVPLQYCIEEHLNISEIGQLNKIEKEGFNILKINQ